MGRRRWRVPNRYPSLGGRWGTAFTAYFAALPPAAKKTAEDWFQGLRIQEFRDDRSLCEVLKELGGFAKKYGEFVTNWKVLVNWELFGGYKTQADDEQFQEDVRDWLNGRLPPHEWKDGSFYDLFNQGCLDFLQFWKAPRAEPLPLPEYCGSLMWARGGASSEAGVEVLEEGKRLAVRGSKVSSSLAIPPSKVEERILSYTPQVSKAIQKLEGGKVRAVVNSDLDLYLKMDWLSTWVEAGFKGSPISTLFMTGSAVADFWERFASGTLDERWVKAPLDQSRFDHQPDFRMLGHVLDAVERLLVTDQQRLVLSHVRRAMLGGGTVDVEGARFPITKGIVSGWRWTALIDTWINHAEMYAATHYIRQVIPRAHFEWVVQGDDVRELALSEEDVVCQVEALVQAGFVINPGKFFISRKRDEFLRRVSEHGRVSGYPARAMLGILWRNPIKEEAPAGDVRIRECLSRWTGLANRGADPGACFRMFVADAARGSALPGTVVRRWAHTPEWFGGGGMVPYTDQPVQIKVQGGRASFSLPSAPGAAVGIRSLGALGVLVPEQVVQDYAREALKPAGKVRREARTVELVEPQLQPRRVPKFGDVGVPTSAVPLRGPWPAWLIGGTIAYYASRGDRDAVRRCLDTRTGMWSDWIRRNHGVWTWREWLRGGLTPPGVTVPSWDSAFLAARYQGWFRTRLRAALACAGFRRDSFINLCRRYVLYVKAEVTGLAWSVAS
nr:MAG: RNA-dependent RNA polymerase [Hubei toti-like virus 17]